MRNLTKRERLHCNECGRGCGHETIDCPRKQRVNAVSDDSENATPLMGIAQANWDDGDIAQIEQACAMIKPMTTNQRQYPQQQQTQPFRQPRPTIQQKPDFLREQQARNNFQAGGNNRGNTQRFGNSTGQKRFEGCYNCGQVDHLIAQCPHPIKAKGLERDITVTRRDTQGDLLENPRNLWTTGSTTPTGCQSDRSDDKQHPRQSGSNG